LEKTSRQKARYCELRFLGGFAAAAAARGRLRGCFADEFGGPHRSDEFLYAVIVKINRRAIGIRLRNRAHAVLLVTYRLPLR
jgi:hypothetical protein